MSLTKRYLVLVAILLATIATPLSWGTPLEESRLVQLHSIDQLKEDFNRTTGHHRLVLLLSPT